VDCYSIERLAVTRTKVRAVARCDFRHADGAAGDQRDDAIEMRAKKWAAL